MNLRPTSILAITLVILICHACENEESSMDQSELDLVINKYQESYNRIEYQLRNSQRIDQRDQVFDLIDAIRSELNTGTISPKLRNRIIDQFNQLEEKSFPDGKSYSELKMLSNKMGSKTKVTVYDLELIDQLLRAKYLQYWAEGIDTYEVEALMNMDTMILEENREYEIPIRLSYRNSLSPNMSIISNTLQMDDPNSISFTTRDHNTGYQTITYQCEVLNQITGETATLDGSLYIKPVRN